MRKLEPPIHNTSDVYALCISKVRDEALKTRLQNVAGEISAAAVALQAAGLAGTFHEIAPATMVGEVTAGEMSDVYDSRMARKEAPGRPVYDQLISAVPHRRCPICGQRTVSTLDHYMPKAHFPALAVAPLNLVPACADCNKKKLATYATTAAEQTLHPYFDDFDADIWLQAEVMQTSPPALRYFVDAPASWTELKSARVQRHFTMFELGALYASHSGEELLNIRYALERLLERAGLEGVRAHLLDEAESRQKVCMNSWQAAMYRALAASDWYCGGGFALVTD